MLEYIANIVPITAKPIIINTLSFVFVFALYFSIFQQKFLQTQIYAY
uniref:Uncharacterized protein n=1 Tax=uncultured marine thaumarchaeote KM3_97_A02 TaxID=1456349 RepID=A0A075HZL4_9ARCH|nr:hypothetical protein [uncultured marine thaumarchaeote KM3_97_A02]